MAPRSNRQDAKTPRESAKRRLGLAFGDRSRRRECEHRLASLTLNDLELSGARLGHGTLLALGVLAVQIQGARTVLSGLQPRHRHRVLAGRVEDTVRFEV